MSSPTFNLIAQVARLRFLRDDATEAGHSEVAQRYQTEINDILRLLHRAAQAGPQESSPGASKQLTTVQ